MQQFRYTISRTVQKCSTDNCRSWDTVWRGKNNNATKLFWLKSVTVGVEEKKVELTLPLISHNYTNYQRRGITLPLMACSGD